MPGDTRTRSSIRYPSTQSALPSGPHQPHSPPDGRGSDGPLGPAPAPPPRPRRRRPPCDPSARAGRTAPWAPPGGARPGHRQVGVEDGRPPSVGPADRCRPLDPRGEFQPEAGHRPRQDDRDSSGRLGALSHRMVHRSMEPPPGTADLDPARQFGRPPLPPYDRQDLLDLGRGGWRMAQPQPHRPPGQRRASARTPTSTPGRPAPPTATGRSPALGAGAPLARARRSAANSSRRSESARATRACRARTARRSRSAPASSAGMTSRRSHTRRWTGSAFIGSTIGDRPRRTHTAARSARATSMRGRTIVPRPGRHPGQAGDPGPPEHVEEHGLGLVVPAVPDQHGCGAEALPGPFKGPVPGLAGPGLEVRARRHGHGLGGEPRPQPLGEARHDVGLGGAPRPGPVVHVHGHRAQPRLGGQCQESEGIRPAGARDHDRRHQTGEAGINPPGDRLKVFRWPNASLEARSAGEGADPLQPPLRGLQFGHGRAGSRGLARRRRGPRSRPSSRGG